MAVPALKRAALPLALAGFALVVPLVAGDHLVYLLTEACLYAVLAISLDLVWGYAGILDLGHSLWFGLGALVVGMLATTVSPSGLVLSTATGVTTYLAGIALAVLVAGVAAAFVAAFAVSSRSSSAFYFSIVTLALATAAQTAYTQFPAITGGENGLFGFALPGAYGATGYYIALAVLAPVCIGAVRFVRSDGGLLLRAVRDYERRVEYLGYNLRLVKIAVFTAGALLGALAGAVHATLFGFVSAPLFGFLFSTEILVWVAVGGRGTIVGPVTGALLLGVVGPQLSQRWPFQWPLFMGVLFVAVVVYAPDGVIVRLARLAGVSIGRTHSVSRRLRAQDTSRPGATAEVVVAVRDVRFAYGSLLVLKGVDLSLRRGELLCIVGPNGAGKSTLMNVLTDGGLGYRGEIRLALTKGCRHRGAPAHRLARAGLSRKFQTPALFPTLSGIETILLATHNGRCPSLWRSTREVDVPPAVLRIVDATGLQVHLQRPVSELAHGLKQGLDIAAAMAGRPEVLLLDEPTAGLVASERELIGGLLRQLRDAGVTIVLVEHDLDFVGRVADRIAVLDEGRVVICDVPAAVVQSAPVREAYLGLRA